MIIKGTIFAVFLTLAVAEDEIADRIVGGKDANFGEFPWLVWFGKDNKLVCHGSLIKENLVLTTKTCYKALDKLDKAYAYLGDKNRANDDSSNPSEKIAITTHVVFDNVAIIKLATMADISKNKVKNVNVVQTATLEDQKKILSRKSYECYIAGWGLKAKGNGKSLVASPKLQKLSVKFTKQSSCKKIKGFDSKNDLCYKLGKKQGPCNFDDGTPIACKYNGDWVVVAMEAGKSSKNSKNKNKKCRGGFVAPVRISAYYADIQKRLDNVYGDASTANYPMDCLDAMVYGLCNVTGPCQLSLKTSYGYKDYSAICNQDIDGGRWTTIQRRFDGSVNFYRRFKDYEYGFGSTSGEYWLGLKWIHALTEAGNTEMRIDLVNHLNETAYQVFQDFGVGRARQYKLSVGSSNGTAGDRSGFEIDDGSAFSTYDNEQMGADFAKAFHTGWWVPNKAGTYVNLNGDYGIPGDINTEYVPPAGFTHLPWNGLKMLKESTIMIRKPKE